MAEPDDQPIEIDATEARAGVQLGVMRYVLGISLVLIIVIFAFIIWR